MVMKKVVLINREGENFGSFRTFAVFLDYKFPVLVALRKIQKGEELLWNYFEKRESGVMETFPWSMTCICNRCQG